MKTLVLKIEPIKDHLYSEWLVTNGIGGFACGSIAGAPMRKYHSLLTSALPAPYGRTIMLNYVDDQIIIDQKILNLSNVHTIEECKIPPLYLSGFRLEDGIPFWSYENEGISIEKTLFLIHRQNTVCVTYKVLSSPKPVEIRWRPYFHFRANEQAVDTFIPNESYNIHSKDYQYEVECPGFPFLRIFNHHLPTFTIDSKVFDNIYYEFEEKRGYQWQGKLISPGYFSMTLNPNERTSFIASSEEWETIQALTPQEAWRAERGRKRNLLKMSGERGKYPIKDHLTLAADQFLMTPTSRNQDMVRLQARGEEVRSIIAGFPWFTDWGRDTMISLEGLTLTTGRERDAYAILHTFAHYVKDGLIPNMFPDGENQGIYNTADATLWFFHAIGRYVEITKDEDIIEFLLPKLREIIQSHIYGTKFGIKVDSDGLLIQGASGLQLTWMDAKVDDWVVTPRKGKAVEINALWYNALKLYEEWSGKSLKQSEQCYETFNRKFWYEEGEYLYDVIEGPDFEKDPSLRPNQLFAISLKHPILHHSKWQKVFDCVSRDLLTPVGLRTLSPNDPKYKSTYDGDLRSRDAAYHQGTVWPWLFGPYIDVWFKLYPEDYQGAFYVIKDLGDYISKNCIGTIAEIFDASSPYFERGCFAQAWSVAELLRCYTKILPKL